MASIQLPPHATARLFASRQKSLLAVQRETAAVALSYTVGQCSYGPIVVARTPKGVCAVLLGNEDKGEAALLRDLVRRFPKSRVQRAPSDGEAEAEMRSICRSIERPGSASTPAVALDLQGTAFQRSVWDALLQVPPGKTVTYSQLAKRAKLPATSVRAVANACGQNHVAFLVPCHRIVRTDGTLGGYHWGVEMKEKMLRLEKEL